MKKLHTIFLTLLVVTLGCMSVQLQAQEVRYVSTTGDNAKDGLTWATAKKDIQEAINDLVNNHKTGEVWVAAGTYYPTETTESTTSLYYKAFKIPAGITVRGGFAGSENTASERAKQADKNFGDGTTPGDLDGEASKSGVYEHKTILCGDLYPSKKAQLTWNDVKQQFDVAFYGNSYHVVWFAMNGFNPTTGRANPLTAPAKLEGCVVEGGHANTHDVLAAHPHIGYGGGIYMVLNSFVYNCEVRNCDASRNGGGIYMDGGGIVRRTYVHDCQTLGLGTEFGYGGGICQDGGAFTSKERPCVVAQSVVTNCVGRMGGGIAIMADQAQESGKYAVVSNSTLVNNCTATIEAGGVYTYKGGGVASLTIVNNRCNGSGITQNGLVTGSSGGLYSHDAAYVANSVIWGNKCDANKDAQFASSRSSVNVTEKTKFYYNALSHVDNTSWSNILKMGVVSLSVENKASGHKESEGYPLFFKPTAEAGYLASATSDDDIDWMVSSESSLCFAGLATSDLDYEGVTPAPQGVSYDMQFSAFNARPTIGALISQMGDLAPAQDITYNGVKYDKAFFVSPGYVYAEDNTGTNGANWEHPALFLGNVLDFIALHPAEFEGYSLAIFVKEGAVDNTRAWSNSRVRQTALEVPSNVAIFGSFNSHLTGQNLNMQNVVQTPTIITGQLMNEYRFNLPHLLVVKDQQNILIEGFKLSFANASSTLLGNSNTNGAAITLDNSHDIRFRNVIVSNSTADRGAAVYATHAEATFENCIFHNNESKTIEESGIIYATDGSTLTFDHCDVLRNVGHASYLGSNSTTNLWQNSIFYGNLSQTVDDTNIDRANSDQLSSGLNALSLAAFSGTTAGAEGNHCMFDARSAQFASQFGGGSVAGGGDTGNQWQYNLQYAFIDGTGQGYPRFINPTKNCGVTQDGDQTYYGRATSFEPHNNNPVVNMASHADIHTSWGRDIVGVTRDFGGLPDIGAVENHEATHAEEGENAYTDGQKAYGEGYFVRDYQPATGTQMATYDKANDGTLTLNAEGLGIYNAAGELLDGTSWEYAINGNGTYSRTRTDIEHFNTVYKSTHGATDTSNFRGTFTISTGGSTYIYLTNTGAPKTTTDAEQATHFEVENVTTHDGVAAGTMYIRAVVGTKYYYLYRNSNNASGTSTQQRVDLVTAAGGFNINANGQLYLVDANGNITAPKNAKTPTVWTFNPVYGYLPGSESAYMQDGTTPVTNSTEGYTETAVAQDEVVVEPMKFHVYKSLDDFLYSDNKKTYRIRGSVNASNSLPVHLTNNDNYFNPTPSWLGDGDEFAIIQDGAADKYYIYDATTGKYLIYKTGGSSRIQAGTDIDKTTWWIKPKDGDPSVLQFVYGGQPWTTTGSYALSFNANQNLYATVAAKSVAQTALYLVASQGYNAINYSVSEEVNESLRGLQYAVNTAHKAFNADYAVTSSYERSKKSVWVGAGLYQSDPTFLDADNEKTQYEDCFVIQDGVDVFGAFPKTGNPGLDQRQALVSQYVHVQTDNNGDPLYDYRDFETILEPLTPTTMATAANVTRRVLGQPYTYNPRKYFDAGGKNSIGTCPHFKGAKWDGFTLRNGWYDANKANYKGREGGAGAEIYHNVTLKNVIITNNTTINSVPGSQTNIRGGGLYMDGGILDAGYVINNVLAAWYATDGGSFGTAGGAGYGGGVYMYSGTTFNSVIANNRAISAFADGGGIYIENANFFNNTIVNNKSVGKTRAAGGVGMYSDQQRGDNSTLNVYNCIILNNEGYIGIDGTTIGDKDFYISNQGHMRIHNCIVENPKDVSSGTNKSIDFYDCKTVNDAAGFAALIENMGSYSDRSENNFKNLNLRLKSGSVAINSGIDAPTAYDYNLAHNVTYYLEEFNDMDYTERIQDCRVDIGAYEFNGATGIAPHMIGANGQTVANINQAEQLVFYVTPNGYGSTNAHDPANAACAQKLQRVLDAAGRYKYLNPGKQVIVKVANSYDFLHPDNGTKQPGDDGYVEPTNFTYYATRTTDWTNQDVRVWSIIVPRGVEVWGGYTDVPVDANWEKTSGAWSNTNNGFTLSDGVTDHRNITKNPTYFDSYYLNKLEKTDAHTYHVVTFSDRVYDLNGYAYLASEGDKVVTGAPSTYLELLGSDESLFLHMSEKVSGNVITEVVAGNTVPKNFGTNEAPKYASNRAVIDGIFVSGGQADAPSSSTSTTLNVNSYGGAALVNDFAYVRNCILTGNTAINGGALALTDNALVSGCLIVDNEAHNQGGGIYVFEEGAKLSDGTTIESMASVGQTMDQNMAHVLTSTIVRNRAQQGGGVWYTEDFEANARFNSVAIWQNEAVDQPNVYGMVNPEQPTEDETIAEFYYPFSYSLIQNMRASGTNNISAEALNRQGVRFVKATSDVGQSTVDQLDMAEEQTELGHDKFEQFEYYGLTNYSTMCSTGMSKSMYEQLRAAIAISDVDLLGTPRTVDNSLFVEIGARALPKVFPTKQLMLRIFVANPEDVDTEVAGRFMRLAKTAVAGSAAEYYAQEGSSFAYPFNFLQDALDYVKAARNGEIIKNNDDSPNYDAQNLPFEIIVGKGYYYPRKDLNGETKSVWAHSFAIPEGVTIVGGFNPEGGVGTYYGRYNQAKATINTTSAQESLGQSAMSIYNNVSPIPTGTQRATEAGQREIGRGYKSGNEEVELPAVGTYGQPGYMDAQRVTFQQWDIQDICDRRAMFDNNKNGIIEPWEFKHQTIISGNAVNGETDGVYHVMTAVADADAVGNLPAAGYLYDQSFTDDGYHSHEYGQQIRLNGLIITGGNALTYLSTALDEYGKYIYYQGAGLQVDGNRYKAAIDAPSAQHTEPVFHNSAAYGVGYRDIPISVINCQFRNNVAGYGGAISTNGTLDTYATSFEQNLAIAQTETPKAGDDWFTMVSGNKQTVNKVMYPGQGGAILATGQLSCYNTLFANNEARLGDGEEQIIDRVKHPTFRVPNEEATSPTLRAAGGAVMIGSAGRYHMMNCDFVRNKANAYPVIFTMNPNSTEDEKGEQETTSTENYNQIVSTAVWGNEVNPDMLNRFKDNTYYQFASKMMVNVGKKDRGGASEYPNYDPTFAEGNVPSSQADLDANWKEFVWFSAYEDGVGFTQKNTYDLRDHIIFKTGQFVNWNIRNAAKVVNPSLPDDYFQNCNIQIVADNNDVAGPNFGNPSYRAGYDGFMEGADWSPTRFNRLTDNGSGWIKQTVTQTADDFVVTFDTPDPENKNDYYQGGYPVAHYDTYPEYKLWLAIGNEKYMQATNDTEVDEIFINNTSLGHPNKNYPRISPDPTMGVTKAYIDIGVYEYQKQPLLKPGSEVDILWVSTKEHPENGPATGATWSTPTSDLQRAINTLLSSRNGHKKEIRIMEGEYTPVTPQTVGGNKYHAFVIDTESLNGTTITPSGFNDGTNNAQYYAQSLTIKGGYSSELMYEYDPAQYKTVIRQNNTNDGASTDYLLYIADPTLRYAYGESSPGVSGYNDSNKQGATYGTDPATESATARTMPIQVDGVTLINDRATAGTKGSTIYYPDYPDAVAPATTITEAHSISVGGKVVYYETKEEMDKVDSDGVTHIGETVDYETEFALITETNAETISNPAKLVITKTHVVGSGSRAAETPATASAVYIGKNGGSALIYNSVFHSNYGMPLDAWNTVNVNNTFGLNAGKVNLTGTASEMHNSALWRNNPTSATTYGAQFTGATNYVYNSYTGCTTDANNNTALADMNSNIAEGPNFVDPENADIEARNFDIKPSVRLLNKGSLTDVEGWYYDKVMHHSLGNSKYANYDYALIPTTGVDVMNRPRFAHNIDVGAYEFQGSLLNPLYVDPNKSHSDAATGENWDNAFGYGDIQNAMDLAALYHMNTPAEEAYVFVKGASATNKDLHTNESLTIRDGVTVYGSIISSYSDWHGMKDAGGVNSKYNDIPNYIKDMTSIREGVASNGASKTVVSSISTAENSRFDAQSGTTPALVDGFVVSPADPAQQPTAPVINVTNPSENAAIGLRNIIVADNDLSGAPDAAGTDIDVAQVSNGLIYEVLMRDNKPKGTGAVLRMSDRGYAVNVTVEGKTIGADGSQPVDGNAGFDAEKAAHIFNSITNSITPTTPVTPHAAGGERPYGNITNKHISGYFYNIADPNLNYQLTETSKYIDQCDVNEDSADGELHPSFLPANLAKFITYRTDRDILGNPRVLASVTDQGKVDRGAFETWKVQNTPHKFICGDQGTIAANGTYTASKYSLIKKHYYPHDGSVCYIMEGHDLVIDPVDEHEVKPTPHNPGYMLVQEGASFYGNGRPATCAYVAVERKVQREGSIVSMPYDMDYYADANIPSYDESGYLTFLRPYAIEDVMDYNGTMRSDWQYKIQSSDSPCWMHNEDDVILANKGVYIQPAVEAYFAEEEKQKTYRFTAKGTGIDDYVYVENSPVKSVTLTQNDDRESTGGAADFTKPEDMGWNCVGLPYLVSNYQSYDWVDPTDPLAACAGTQLTDRRRMHIPHQMWLWYDGTQDAKGNTNLSRGGYYSVNSWDAASWATHEDEAAIWVGEGIFLQTASNTGTETVQFYLPDYKTLTSSTRRQMRLRLTDAVEEDDLTPLAPAPRTRKVTVKAGLLSLAPSEGASAIEVYDTQGHQLYTTDHKTLITLPNGVYILRERE